MHGAQRSKTADKNVQFVDGCTSYKAESIAIHELSQFHRDAVMHMDERNKPITSSQAGKAKQALQKDVMGKLDKLCGTSQSDNCSADRANVSKVLMPTRPGGTRWVKHTNRALTNLIASYRYIITHLTQVRMNHIRQRSYFYLQQIYSAFIATHDVCLYLDKLKIQMININK